MGAAFRAREFRRSAALFLGLRRVRNRQFGTTARRDAPRGNAPARFKDARRNDDDEIYADDSRPSCPRTAVRRTASLRSPMSRASTRWRRSKAWMAGTSPAMTNVAVWRNEPEAPMTT